jgi:hypothetical protein
MTRYLRSFEFLGDGGVTRPVPSKYQNPARPEYEALAGAESQRLMDAADELAAEQANGADIALLMKTNPELAQTLMRVAAQQIGYRGAGANDPADHDLDISMDPGAYDRDETDGGDEESLLPEATLMDELESLCLDEGYESAQDLAEQDNARLLELMAEARQNLRSYGL